MAPIRNVFETKRIIEEQATPEDNADFEERVTRAYENPNTLEFARAVAKARELISEGLTYGKMIKRGEKAAQELCGDDLEADVVVGAMKKIKELEKSKTIG